MSGADCPEGEGEGQATQHTTSLEEEGRKGDDVEQSL